MHNDDYDSEFEEDEGGKATVFGHAFDWGEAVEVDLFETVDTVQPDVLRFELAGHGFAVEALHVSQVGEPPVLTAVPGLPPHLAGVAVRRRQVLSVLDLGHFFGLTAVQGSDERLIVFEHEGLEAGAVVSAILGLEAWPDDAESQIEDVDERIRPFVSSSRWAPGGRVLLLDIPELLRAAAVR